MSTLTTGLYLEPDSAPYTSTTLSTNNALVDGDKFTLAGGTYWYTHYSYGIDFGLSTTVSGMSVYGIVASSTPTDWYDSSHDSFSVYKSSDNSTWTHVEDFDAPPIIHSAALQWGFELAFSVNQTARFFKIVYTDSTTIAFQPGGLSGSIGEIVPHPVVYYYDGYVKEQGNPISRSVRLYYRDTGELMDTTTSSGTTGYYYLTSTVSGTHFIVAFDDDEGEVYNALILDRLTHRGIE